MEKVSGAKNFFGMPKKRRLKQKYQITSDASCADYAEYRHALRQEIFSAVTELAELWPRSWGQRKTVLIQHDKLGKFQIRPHGRGLTELIDNLLRENDYLEDGYLTIKMYPNKN